MSEVKEKPRVDVNVNIPKEEYKFDPNWSAVYDPRKKSMTRNMYGMSEQLAMVCDQLEAATQIINEYEQRIHELESRLSQVEKDNTILANTKDDAPKRGRPPKKEASGEE